MLYFVWCWVDLRFVWMGSFKLLTVQQKAEVTKLWAFKFGICTGRITVGTKWVVPAWPGIRRSLLLWQSAAELRLALGAAGRWNVLLLLQCRRCCTPPWGCGEKCKPLFKQECWKNAPEVLWKVGFVLYFLNGNYCSLLSNLRSDPVKMHKVNVKRLYL